MQINPPGSGLVDTFGAVTASSTGTQSTGAYAQLTAATPREYDGFFITSVFDNMQDGSDNNMTFDIAMGAGGSEKVLIEKLKFSDYSCQQTNGMPFSYIPIRIPRGVRLAVKTFDGGGGFSGRFILHPCAYGPYGIKGFSRAEVMGYSGTAFVGGNKGVDVQANASANTKGNFVQIIASTANRYQGLMMVCSGANQQSANGSEKFLIDIAVGSSGNEKVIVANLLCSWGVGNGFTILLPWCFGVFPVDIPAGSRLSVRCQYSQANGTNKFDALLYGFIR